MSTIQLKYPVPLQPYMQTPKHFIVVGAGGTGGHLVPNLARLIASLPSNKRVSQSIITLIDGDEVEEKNITRQNFVMSDVGKNKADVLAARYSMAFGTTINSYSKYIEDPSELYQIIDSSDAFPVIIGCVDNNKTRQLIHKVFTSRRNYMFWIDSGNEEFSGQVVLGYNSYYWLDKGRELSRIPDPEDFYVPPVTKLYPEILQDDGAKFNSELSCAERAVSAPQSIMANITAASLIMNFVAPLLTSPEGKGITVHQVRFNVRNSTFTTDFIYPDEIYERIKQAG